MNIFAIFVCTILAVSDYIKNKNILSPTFVISLLFLFQFFIIEINYYQLNSLKIKTYLIVVIGLLSFAFGQWISKKIKKKTKKYDEISKKRYNTLIILSSFFSFFMIKNSIKIILLGGGIEQIYSEKISSYYLSDTLMQTSTMEGLIINNISSPLVLLSIVTSLVLFYKTFEKKYFFISFIFLVIQTLSTAGRTSIILYIIYNFLCFSTLKAKRPIVKKNIIKIIAVSVLVIVSVNYIFGQRGTQIFSTIMEYYGLPIAHMEYKLNDLGTIINTYGFLSFQAVLSIISYFVESIGIARIQLLQTAKDMIYFANTGVSLSNNAPLFNTFVTCFYYFYIDMGILGVILLSCLFGYFSGWCFYRCIYNKNNLFYKIIFCISFAGPVFFSMVRFQYIEPQYPLSMIFCYIILFRKSKYRINISIK